jgi:hypothetical protein
MNNMAVEPTQNFPSSTDGYSEVEHSLSINPGNMHYRTQTMATDFMAQESYAH